MSNSQPSNSPKEAAPDFRKQAGRSQPARPLTDGRFRKHHLAISHGEYDQVFRNRNQHAYGKGSSLAQRLKVREIIDATGDEFIYHLQRVGRNYGWDKREKYQPENRSIVNTMMDKETTRMYVFYVDGKEAGFCLMTAIDEEPNTKRQGVTKKEALSMFRAQRRIPDHADAVEIYKIGLYDEFTGQKYGHFFLAKMLQLAFDRDGHDIVYLDTRDTNHRGVLSFYAVNGVDTFLSEELDSDLVENAPQALPPHYGDGRAVETDPPTNSSIPHSHSEQRGQQPT